MSGGLKPQTETTCSIHWFSETRHDLSAAARSSGFPAPPAPPTLARQLAETSTSEIWLGRLPLSHEPVAVKRLKPAAASDPLWLAGFCREAKLLPSLDHRHIIRTLAVGNLASGCTLADQQKTLPYLVMEWAKGGSLQPYCGWLCWSELRTVLLQLLEALHYLHDRGLLHLDLKPANVLLAADDPTCGIRLADFELAQPFPLPNDPLSPRELIGTPAYMAPEQILANRAAYGPSTDLYGLGCLAFSLATGAPPSGVAPKKAAKGHLEADAFIFQPRIDLPARFDHWLGRLLRKHADERYPSASEAAAALHRLDAHHTRSSCFSGKVIQCGSLSPQWAP
jgi:serine/threonine protein kinase